MGNEDTAGTPPLMSGRLYDFLKMLVQLLLPAFATLYFTLASIWGLPNAEAIVGTLAALATFLGVFLRLSSKSYNESELRYDGSIDVTTNNTGGKLFTLELNSDPSELDLKTKLLFKVKPYSGD